MDSILAEQIVATLIYYDLFDFPLTCGELKKNLVSADYLGLVTSDRVGTMGQIVEQALAELVGKGMIGFKNNFYFLADREYLVPLRREREHRAKAKWRVARRAARFMRLLPFTRALLISGSLAYSNTDELSDLDFLIVVEAGHIWLTRLMILATLSLFRMRRRNGQTVAPGKVCPNHFITTRSLTIPFENIYNAQTYNNLVPLYLESPALVNEFYNANIWLKKYLVKTDREPIVVDNNRALSFIGRSFKRFLEVVVARFSWFENSARQLQTKRIVPCTGISISDQALAFHPHSPAQHIEQAFKEKLL